MQSFLQKVELGLNHVQVMVRGMYSVAVLDGLHPTELVLLREFYESCRAEVDGLASFEEVIAGPLEEASMRDILDTKELQEVFLKSCLLLAFADGVYSPGECAQLKKLAGLLDFDDEQRAHLEQEVRGHLLQRIAHIHNLDALRDVAKELG